MDLAHCGGILAGKKIAAMAAAQDLRVAPHCSIGPVALAACLHFDVSTPNFLIQEAFAEFDVPWRNDLVGGWNPIRNGEFVAPDEPGLGLELDEQAIADHPYVPNAFPSLWDGDWQTNFTQDRAERGPLMVPTLPHRLDRRFPRRIGHASPTATSAWAGSDSQPHDPPALPARPGPRAGRSGYWSRLYSLEVTPEHIQGRRRPGRPAALGQAEHVRRGPDDLVVIGRSGAGYDKIDLAACTEHGVAVFNAPLALNHSTARRPCSSCWPWPSGCPEQERITRQGRWDLQAVGDGQRDSQGRTLGIVGLGHSGRELARLVAPFAMRDPRVLAPRRPRRGRGARRSH